MFTTHTTLFPNNREEDTFINARTIRDYTTLTSVFTYYMTQRCFLTECCYKLFQLNFAKRVCTLVHFINPWCASSVRVTAVVL